MNIIKITNTAISLILLSACSGGDEDPTFATETDSGTCALQPGDYSVEYSVVSDTCDFGPLPTELLIIGPSGTVAGSTEPPTGCVDDVVTTDGCVVGLSRDCLIPTVDGNLEAEIDFSFNFESGRGSVTGLLYLTSSNVVLDQCSFNQRANISKLR